ncbi:MAG: hypothetical protein QM523_01150 [Candidatus Pacebacteria bacterium]|nr:hypothetical protein [Candidatus Paceibacterota bacterium]
MSFIDPPDYEDAEDRLPSGCWLLPGFVLAALALISGAAIWRMS